MLSNRNTAGDAVGDAVGDAPVGVTKPTLREAREARGLQVAQLARLSGIEPRIIGKIERGRLPFHSTQKRLARALGLHPQLIAWPEIPADCAEHNLGYFSRCERHEVASCD